MRPPREHALLDRAVRTSTLAVFKGRIAIEVLLRETQRLARLGDVPEEAGLFAATLAELDASVFPARLFSVNEFAKLLADVAFFATPGEEREYLEARQLSRALEARRWAEGLRSR